jgi:hypothetical protein
MISLPSHTSMYIASARISAAVRRIVLPLAFLITVFPNSVITISGWLRFCLFLFGFGLVSTICLTPGFFSGTTSEIFGITRTSILFLISGLDFFLHPEIAPESRHYNPHAYLRRLSQSLAPYHAVQAHHQYFETRKDPASIHPAARDHRY